MRTSGARGLVVVIFVIAANAAWGAADDHWASGFTIQGADDIVGALTVDGSGALYVGGYFSVMYDKVVNHVAKWNGSTWSPLGSGMNGVVYTLAVDGSGNVYAGGDFTTAGGVTVNYVAKWDGSSWSALGSGMDTGVNAVAVDGSGDLYAGGSFTTAGGVTANHIAKWNGSSWAALGSGMDALVGTLAVHGGNVYAGGSFTTAGGVTVNHVAKWDGSSWSALGTGMNYAVRDLAVDGSGNVYAGGDFTTAGGVTVNHVAKWDGSSWSALGSGMDNTVHALAVDTSGNVYAGGAFMTAGGVSAHCVAKWSGTAWSALGSGMDNAVYALAVDSSGNVYAGGTFWMAGGVSAMNIAKWDGTSWSALGTGANATVRALAVGGSSLYVGGDFTWAGDVGTGYIAKWDGLAWSALGTGTNRYVYALVVDGSGNVYAGGEFTTANFVAANGIAKWNGSSWSALGSGVDESSPLPQVSTLALDGSGNVYAGGHFATAGGVSANHIAKWNGSEWSALGSGIGGGAWPRVSALAVDNSGDLYAGGEFAVAGGKVSDFVAKWFNTPPVSTGAPMVTGTYATGRQLSASNGSWTDAQGDTLAYSYQWLRADDATGTNSSPIAGATASTYTLASADELKYVCMRVTANDGYGGTTNAQSAYVVCPGPVARFALALSGLQTDGVAFTGTNTLTAQDINGNTVTTFSASADNVTIVANAPLTGTVTGLGSGGSNILNRAGDFANGVANLTTLGMKYTGNATTGMFTATSGATGKTGTSGNVTISIGALSNFLVEHEGGGDIPAQTVGASFNLRITGRDVGNNTVTSFIGTVDLTSNAALAGAPVTTDSFSAGVFASQSVTMNSGQSGTTITATRSGGGPAGTSNAFVVQKLTQTITFGALGNKTYGGAAFTVSASASSSLPISFSIASGPATINGNQVTITGAGTVTVRASQSGDAAYSPAPIVEQSFDVAKGTPTITWANPADIVYGTALSSTQLNAHASVTGQYSYTPASGTVLSVGGSQTLRVNFTSADSANYNSTSATVAINVVKATPAITWANPASIVYGTPLSGSQLNATANTAGTFTYTPAAGTVLSPGNVQTLRVDFAPDDAASYVNTSATATINVVKATPKITWANPADLIYGNALSTAQLNATADIAGTFSYSPAAGAVLNPGDGQTLSVSFAPNDTANYTSASATATINVKPAVVPTITSALTASATQGLAFSYIITASGSTPMTFGAESLPSGLGFSGNTINGTPTVGGVISIALKATNAAGSDAKTLQLTITKPAGTTDNAPTVSSPPTANAPTGATGQPATFTAAATDSDGDILGYTWDFGDGTTGTGSSASHTYTTPGIYTVTVTISDGTTTTQQQTDFVVSAGEAPVGDDNGGDDKWGTSGLDAFGITKVSLKLNFAAGTKDTLQLSGTIPVAKFFKPLGKKVTVLIGGFKKDFPLNAKGQGTAGASKFQMKGKMKKGVFKATPAKFTLTVKGEPLLAALQEYGFANKTTAKTGEQVDMSTIIMVDTLGYEADITVLYKATQGKSGKASKTK